MWLALVVLLGVLVGASVVGLGARYQRRMVSRAPSRWRIRLWHLFVVFASVGVLIPASLGGVEMGSTAADGKPFVIYALAVGVGVVGTVVAIRLKRPR